MYDVIKNSTKMFGILVAAALIFAVSTSDARERFRTEQRAMVPSGIAVNEILGMEVRTQDGQEIASIEDVVVTRTGQVKDVVLEYEGDMVAVPIQDLRFTASDHAVYMGTRRDLDAAVEYYASGAGPGVYSRGYRDDRMHRGDRVYKEYEKPDTYGTWPQSGYTPPSGFGHRDPSAGPFGRETYEGDTSKRGYERDTYKRDTSDAQRPRAYGYYGYDPSPNVRTYGTWPESGYSSPSGFGHKDPTAGPYGLRSYE